MLPFRRILCPIDFSERSIAAIEAASELATHFNAELCILHVVYPTPTMPLAPEPVPLVGPGPWEAAPSIEFDQSSYEPEPTTKETFDDVMTQLTAKGLKFRLIAVPGKAPEEISAVARDEHADLIVMTTHGYTGLEHFLFGSIAEKTARETPCPVLIIRRSEKYVEEQEEGKSKAADDKSSDTRSVQKALESQLRDLSSKIDELKAKFDESKTDFRLKYADQIQELKTRKKEMENKIAQYMETGSEAWEELKVGLADLWSSFDKAFSKFREKKEEAVEDLTEKKRSYERRIEAELHEWATKIDVLKAKAEASKTEAKNIYIEQIEDLKSKQELAIQKLHQLRESGVDAWEDIKSGLDEAVTDLGKAIKDALSRFQ